MMRLIRIIGSASVAFVPTLHSSALHSVIPPPIPPTSIDSMFTLSLLSNNSSDINPSNSQLSQDERKKQTRLKWVNYVKNCHGGIKNHFLLLRYGENSICFPHAWPWIFSVWHLDGRGVVSALWSHWKEPRRVLPAWKGWMDRKMRIRGKMIMDWRS